MVHERKKRQSFANLILVIPKILSFEFFDLRIPFKNSYHCGQKPKVFSTEDVKL